jgi:hypothetical protein
MMIHFLVTRAKVGKQGAGRSLLGMCGKKEGCLGFGPKKFAVDKGIIAKEGGRILVDG